MPSGLHHQGVEQFVVRDGCDVSVADGGEGQEDKVDSSDVLVVRVVRLDEAFSLVVLDPAIVQIDQLVLSNQNPDA